MLGFLILNFFKIVLPPFYQGIFKSWALFHCKSGVSVSRYRIWSKASPMWADPAWTDCSADQHEDPRGKQWNLQWRILHSVLSDPLSLFLMQLFQTSAPSATHQKIQG